MNFTKVCMECGNVFEDTKLFNGQLSCPKCGCVDIHEPAEEDYHDITLQQCFETYHENKIACQCDGDNKLVIFMEE